MPGGPGAAEFYEDGTGIVDGIPASWNTCDDLELGDGLCPGLVHLNAMHIFSLKDIQHITISHLVMITMEGWHDDESYNGQNVDGQTSIQRVAQRNNDANIVSDLNGVNPVAPYPNPQIDENIFRERDLTSFEIYRDGVSLVTLDSDVFSYRDEDVVNMT